MEIPSHVANAIVDPAAYAAGEPAHEALAWLRANAPLDVVKPDGYDSFWAVVRHADVLDVERRADIFLNGLRPGMAIDIPGEQRVRELTGGKGSLLHSMLDMDSPQHMKYRRITQARFMPQNIKSMEGQIRAKARRAIDQMADFGNACDFAQDVAFLYPLHVIMDLLGVPAEDEPLMLRLTQEAFGNSDPEAARAGAETSNQGDLDVLNAVIGEIMAYFGSLTADRRQTPRDDLATLIANGQVDGENLGAFEAGSYYFIIATAGHDTTSSSLSGSMWAAAAFPEILQQLRDDPAKIGAFVDEAIRWTTPVKHFMRTAKIDTEVGGRKITAGDWLMLSYASANRDEAVFPDADRFDLSRPMPNKHVSFGYGPHNCLGQHLARLELKIFWEELLPRLKSVALTASPTRTRSNCVCGPKSVPIAFELA